MLDADLLLRIREIWDTARLQAARSVNSAHVAANWLIGQQIVEAEQGGTDRAAYGTRLLESLSAQLSVEYGNGFSVSALRYMRLFYLGYPGSLPIHQAVRDESEPREVETSSLMPSNLRALPTGAAPPDW